MDVYIGNGSLVWFFYSTSPLLGSRFVNCLFGGKSRIPKPMAGKALSGVWKSVSVTSAGLCLILSLSDIFFYNCPLTHLLFPTLF